MVTDHHGRRAAVEGSEVHRLDVGGEVAGALARHRPGCQHVRRQQFQVQQRRLDQLAVVAEEERAGAEDLQEQRLLAEADHHAALAFQRIRCVRGVEAVPALLVVLEPVHVLEERTGGRSATGVVEAADPLPDAALPVAAARAANAVGQLGPDIERRASGFPAVGGLAGFPAAGFDAEGVDVAGFAGAKDDVAGTRPVLLPAFEQLAFQQQRGVRSVVGDGEAGHLGAACELGDGDVGVGARADAEAAGA